MSAIAGSVGTGTYHFSDTSTDEVYSAAERSPIVKMARRRPHYLRTDDRRNDYWLLLTRGRQPGTMCRLWAYGHRDVSSAVSLYVSPAQARCQRRKRWPETGRLQERSWSRDC